eukprot:355664-Chlamydomonas_euryale.AAC.14
MTYNALFGMQAAGGTPDWRLQAARAGMGTATQLSQYLCQRPVPSGEQAALAHRHQQAGVGRRGCRHCQAQLQRGWLCPFLPNGRFPTRQILYLKPYESGGGLNRGLSRGSHTRVSRFALVARRAAP